MINNTTSLSMAESLKYIKKTETGDSDVVEFIKKFTELKTEKAKEIRKKIEGLNLLKVKPEHISKIIDLVPEDKESLNKIFTDVSLDEDESKQVLDAIEEFK